MSTKQEVCDMRMIRDYEIIHRELINYQNKVILIARRIEEINKNIEYENLYPITQDLEHIVKSLEYMYVSCISRDGLRNSFYPYTTFYREIISMIAVIDGKLETVLEENNIYHNDIEKDYQDVKIFMEKEFKWRGSLVHYIDPFYDGELYTILKELNINKIVTFIELVYKLLKKINLRGIKKKTFKEHVMKYGIIPLEERKIIIENLNEVHNKIFEMIIEISYISMNNGLNQQQRNVIDILFKYLEVKKLYILLIMT